MATVSLFKSWTDGSFTEPGESGSLTLLRPSLGRSGDIAVRHHIEPQRRGCVSRARSGSGCCWDLL